MTSFTKICLIIKLGLFDNIQMLVVKPYSLFLQIHILTFPNNNVAMSRNSRI